MGAVRTPETNPCVKEDLSTNKMDSKVLISMRELSQILATTGILISQEENILIAVESLSTSPGIEDETQSQELQKDFLCKSAEEADILGITSEGERHEIEEFSTYLLADPSRTQAIEQLEEEEMYGLRKEGDYQYSIER